MWYMTYYLCSLVSGYLSCFYFFPFLNSAAMNTGIKIPVRVLAFSSFGSIPKSRVVHLVIGSYSNSMFHFFEQPLF